MPWQTLQGGKIYVNIVVVIWMKDNKKKLIFSIVIVLVLVTVYVLLSPNLGADEEYNPGAIDSFNNLSENVESYEPDSENETVDEQVNEEPEIDLSEFKAVTVKRVVDGDTFIYDENGDNIRVRMIGIDTPESVAPEETGKTNTSEGKTVSDYVKDLLTGETVYLEYDAGPTDKFDRELCYVYLSDGTRIQDMLISMGYAKTMTIQPNVKYAEHFVELEQEAHDKKVGFWNGYFEEWK